MSRFKQLELAFPNTNTLSSLLSLRERRTTKSPGEGRPSPSQPAANVEFESGERCHRASPVVDSPRRVRTVFETFARPTRDLTFSSEKPIHLILTCSLEALAGELLRTNGAGRIADEVRVKWNPRLRTCAGRADYRKKLISLNPQLHNHPGEIDRTFRHELAHLLAQFRSGRRRILPHGAEWRAACIDLGIGDEKRCHDLPFASGERARRFLYRCPNCKRDFPRVRRIRRAIACLACCRAHNHGKFDGRFRLKLIR